MLQLHFSSPHTSAALALGQSHGAMLSQMILKYVLLNFFTTVPGTWSTLSQSLALVCLEICHSKLLGTAATVYLEVVQVLSFKRLGGACTKIHHVLLAAVEVWATIDSLFFPALNATLAHQLTASSAGDRLDKHVLANYTCRIFFF